MTKAEMVKAHLDLHELVMKALGSSEPEKYRAQIYNSLTEIAEEINGDNESDGPEVPAITVLLQVEDAEETESKAEIRAVYRNVASYCMRWVAGIQ